MSSRSPQRHLLGTALRRRESNMATADYSTIGMETGAARNSVASDPFVLDPPVGSLPTRLAVAPELPWPWGAVDTRQSSSSKKALFRRVSARLATLPPITIPLTLLMVLTGVFWLTDADIQIAGLFYSQSENCWPAMRDQPWHALYRFGQIPGVVMGAACAIFFLASRFRGRLNAWRKPTLFLALVMIVGPGLLVNVTLKPFFGRPRPLHTTEFGGMFNYVHALQRGEATNLDILESFPCGHASIGFFWMAPGFLLFRRHRRLAILVMSVGCLYGFAMGLARMVQGRHFASDVLWAGAIVYLTAVIVYAVLRMDEDGEGSTLATAREKRLVTLPMSAARSRIRSAA
jgi:lipid A 4'-phosphatase